jgi:hypothetical protein
VYRKGLISKQFRNKSLQGVHTVKVIRNYW